VPVPVTVTDQTIWYLDSKKTVSTSLIRAIRKSYAISQAKTDNLFGNNFRRQQHLYGKIERSREAVVQFLCSSNPEDEFFLVGFDDRPELLVDFPSSVEEIQSEIAKMRPDGTLSLKP